MFTLRKIQASSHPRCPPSLRSECPPLPGVAEYLNGELLPRLTDPESTRPGERNPAPTPGWELRAWQPRLCLSGSQSRPSTHPNVPGPSPTGKPRPKREMCRCSVLPCLQGMHRHTALCPQHTSVHKYTYTCVHTCTIHTYAHTHTSTGMCTWKIGHVPRSRGCRGPARPISFSERPLCDRRALTLHNALLSTGFQRRKGAISQRFPQR